MKKYYLCIAENNQRLKVLKTIAATPQVFMEEEPMCFSGLDDDTEEPPKPSDRFYIITSASTILHECKCPALLQSYEISPNMF
ncbi:uncharacterized protein LOC127526739 [Erpetoichthys calabaricus]|uniref:uncharacterized protein LOC127526739 n=1 Tax=Erpetoichthys calabaricus TaxID=27687 RepID=UPI002234518D|nr:uncharacterized protein LOC127526739 [Erpetoichthys calabaricus]